MTGIGGNIEGVIFIDDGYTRNEIGERVPSSRTAVQTLCGWLDMMSGDSRYTTYNAKIEESSHVFIGDYVELDPRIKTSKSRMMIDGAVYDIKFIDNPMEMKEGSQLEIYLAKVGEC